MATQQELEQIVRLHHMCMEFMGVINEFRSMPCSSLEQRMFGTVDRYSRKVRDNSPTDEQLNQLRELQLKEDQNVER